MFQITKKVACCCELFHDGGSYHIETSPLICSTNQWIGFCMIGIFAMMEFITGVHSEVKYELKKLETALPLTRMVGIFGIFRLFKNLFE